MKSGMNWRDLNLGLLQFLFKIKSILEFSKIFSKNNWFNKNYKFKVRLAIINFLFWAENLFPFGIKFLFWDWWNDCFLFRTRKRWILKKPEDFNKNYSIICHNHTRIQKQKSLYILFPGFYLIHFRQFIW